MEKQNILITNDDGISARGLKILIDIAEEFGDVTVVAPERGMSGMSHSITMATPLFLRHIETTDTKKVYACEGTPVDCIKIAIDTLMETRPTLILSGINHGANSNISVIYSGTMGAAIEGATYSIPSLGFSLTSHDLDADFTSAKHYTRKIIADILKHNDNPALCVNVNIPSIPLQDIKGIKVCRQTKGYWKEDFTKQFNPRGKEYYWLVGEFQNAEPGVEGTDMWALECGYVAIVPVQVDMTDYKQLTRSQLWF